VNERPPLEAPGRRLLGYDPRCGLAATAAWQAPVDPEAQREYDGFGPWMLPVRRLEDMPPAFRPLYAEHAEAPFLFKLPRPEERRNLAPGMDLYPTVVAVHREAVVLMSRDGARLRVQRCECAGIQAIRVFQHLLHGQVELLMADGSRFGFGYNGSSQDVIDQVVGFLRRNLPASPGDRDPMGDRAEVPVTDFCYRTALGEQRRLEPDCRVLHSEPMGRACRDLLLRRVLYLGLLVLASPRELILVTQGKSARQHREGALANEVLYVPWASLRGVRLLPARARWRGWRTLWLQVGSHPWELALFEPEMLMRRLGDMVVPTE